MNKVAVITGASSGLGLALAERFVQQGDTVWGISRTKRHWKSALRTIRTPNRFFLVQADLTHEAAVALFFKAFRKKAGRIDFLINNAGYGGELERVEALSRREFQRHLDHNLISAFLMSKYALPVFRKQKRGFMIHIASMAGKRAVPKLAAYSASKFGVVALSQSIAKENADIPLKSICVCPGGMNTKMRAQLFGRADARRQQNVQFVADVIMKIVKGKISVASGGDIIIRHGKIAAINPAPLP